MNQDNPKYIHSKSWDTWDPDPADNFSFPQKDCLRTRKLSILQCIFMRWSSWWQSYILLAVFAVADSTDNLNFLQKDCLGTQKLAILQYDFYWFLLIFYWFLPIFIDRKPVKVSRKPVYVSRKPKEVSRKHVEVSRKHVEVRVSR